MSDPKETSTGHPEPDLPQQRELTRQIGRITLDLYQHPYKRVYPEHAYCYAFDVYWLGIALLEIGCWRSLRKIFGYVEQALRYDEDPFETRRALVDFAKRELPGMCGNTYTQVVVSCLSVEQEDSEEETRELCVRILDDLTQLRV
jgi:hypothetical protein